MRSFDLDVIPDVRVAHERRQRLDASGDRRAAAVTRASAPPGCPPIAQARPRGRAGASRGRISRSSGCTCGAPAVEAHPERAAASSRDGDAGDRTGLAHPQLPVRARRRPWSPPCVPRAEACCRGRGCSGDGPEVNRPDPPAEPVLQAADAQLADVHAHREQAQFGVRAAPSSVGSSRPHCGGACGPYSRVHGPRGYRR